MSMEYIRKHYGVPAKRGKRVRFFNGDGTFKEGVITSARGSNLRIRMDGEKRPGQYSYHPTWNLEYLEEAANE